MTTICETKKKCAICGKISKHMDILSTNTQGSSDLDMRPPEMERSTIDIWIETCPSCGYCAPDISERIEKSPEVVRSYFYKRQLNDPEFPNLANAFLCFSLIQESASDYVGAGWANIHAAWICDDAGSDTGAQKCRKKAVSLLEKAKELGQKFGEQVGVEEAIMIDLLRRSSQFELALKVCDDGLKKKPEKMISDILQFQKVLINKSDFTCHTVTEAIER